MWAPGRLPDNLHSESVAGTQEGARCRLDIRYKRQQSCTPLHRTHEHTSSGLNLLAVAVGASSGGDRDLGGLPALNLLPTQNGKSSERTPTGAQEYRPSQNLGKRGNPRPQLSLVTRRKMREARIEPWGTWPRRSRSWSNRSRGWLIDILFQKLRLFVSLVQTEACHQSQRRYQDLVEDQGGRVTQLNRPRPQRHAL